VATSTAVGPISWSHDDRWIAFDARESALIAEADGSGQHEVAAPACCAIWAPHELRLLVNRVHAADDGGDTYLVTPEGRVIRRVTRPPVHRVRGAPLNTSNSPVAWSRDGGSVLVWSTRTRKPSLYAMRADGSHERRIAPGRNGDFSPSGAQVVYAAKGIWVVRADGTRRRRLADHGAWPRWSPDGRWIAFVATRAPAITGIDLIRPDGTDRHALVGGSAR
jgi:Tol biopolymer transport system component